MSLTRWQLAPAVASVLALAGISTARAEPGMLVPPTELIGGQSQAEWSRAWWQWAGSFARSESPVADRTGALCASNQSGDVWFLAGTYGTKRTIRECTVPAGKFLFFPLINYVVMPPPGRSISCEAVTREAARMTGDAMALILEVDGERFENLHAQRQATTTCFAMGNVGDAQGTVFPSAANGYYIMLRPLRVGRHTINFGGALPSMLQAVTYTLVVR